jgi:hypothetical protein
LPPRKFKHVIPIDAPVFPEAILAVKRRYEGKGGEFYKLWILVAALTRPQRRTNTRDHKSRLKRLVRSVEEFLQLPDLPPFDVEMFKDFDVVARMVWHFYYESENATKARHLVTASVRRRLVNVAVATLAEEFRRRFRSERWRDIHTVLRFMAPHEFPATIDEQQAIDRLRHRARNIPPDEVKACHTRFFG